MATTVFTAEKPVTTGKIPTAHGSLSAADTFKFVNNGKTFLRVTASTTETKVKVAIAEQVDGITPSPREIVVKEASKLIGPFDMAEYTDAEGNVSFTISSATGITIEVISL